MPQREVKQPLATYLDEDGVRRYALLGETVSVHPDHIKAFDELNGGPPQERRTAPKRQPKA